MAGQFPGMRITEAGEDGGEVVRELRRLMTSELAALERAIGVKGSPAVLNEIGALTSEAIIAVVWVARKRSNPTLTLGEVDVDLESLRLDMYNDCGKHIITDYVREGEDKGKPLPCLVCNDLVPDPTAGSSTDDQ